MSLKISGIEIVGSSIIVYPDYRITDIEMLSQVTPISNFQHRGMFDPDRMFSGLKRRPEQKGLGMAELIFLRLNYPIPTPELIAGLKELRFPIPANPWEMLAAARYAQMFGSLDWKNINLVSLDGEFLKEGKKHYATLGLEPLFFRLEPEEFEWGKNWLFPLAVKRRYSAQTEN